jgi:uncharacterized phosphosugar-binding protein
MPIMMASYLAAVEELLEGVRHEVSAIRAAAALVASRIAAGGQVYVFGTGHSHLIALDVFYRAGGLAPVCPILDQSLMLHEGAVESTKRERATGMAQAILARYKVNPAVDCLVVASNSGKNAVPIEMAEAAKAMELPVISISSFAYAAALGGGGLADVADIGIDNHCPPGDSIVALDQRLPPMAPGSTIAGTAILHSILLCAAELLVERGVDPQIFISANMPGGPAHNELLLERWRQRNPHF